MSELASPEARWARACLAGWLVSVDPEGLGGVRLIARASVVRERWLELMHHIPLPQNKLHPNVSDDVLLGGLDFATAAGTGQLLHRAGLFETPSAFVLTMAERCPPNLAGKLAQALDARRGHCLVALEEQASPDEVLPEALIDRLACHVSLDGVPCSIARLPACPDLDAARGRLKRIEHGEAMERLVGISASLGIQSLRAPLLAFRVARAHAALMARLEIGADDVDLACLLTLAPRARQLPAQDEDMPSVKDKPPEADEQSSPAPGDVPSEMLIEAVQAVLPEGVLPVELRANAQGRGGSAGAGSKLRGNRRGRPITPRAGRPDGRQRIDIVATLRAAAPYQRLRTKHAGRIALRAQDIRLRRFEVKSDRLLVFAVDASGSQALTRLGESKGAVELLLARAYASRDHAALVGFRGTGAEVLLPPTRSLLQAKRRLASLPGGGGTPLASGLRDAGRMAVDARRQGLSPVLVLLTDGRANVGLDGQGGRAQAQADAELMAAWVLRNGIDAVVLDTAARPQPALSELAAQMGARVLALPYADARQMSQALDVVARC